MPGGRKSKYTEETIKAVTDAIRLGSTYELAAHYAGIAPSTLYDWLDKKPEFLELIKRAEGKAATTWLARIEEAAKSQWQAAAWKLERRYPQDYGRTVHEHQGKDGGKILLEVVYDSDTGQTDKPAHD